jgi:metallo-beta-lactamase class B
MSLLAGAIALCLAWPAFARVSGDAVILDQDVKILPLTQNIWRHVTYRNVDKYGRVMSNGLIVKTASGITLVDTGWDRAQTQKILDWVARSLQVPVTSAVVSHSHDDRMGGIAVLKENNIPVHASFLTVNIARNDPKLGPLKTPDQPFVFGYHLNNEVELYYPGPGHAIDNIVVWLPEARVLYGGCLIKSADMTSLEPVPGSDRLEWANSVSRLKDPRFNAEIVVPGHGEPGDAGLIDKTIRLGVQSSTFTSRPD